MDICIYDLLWRKTETKPQKIFCYLNLYWANHSGQIIKFFISFGPKGNTIENLWFPSVRIKSKLLLGVLLSTYDQILKYFWFTELYLSLTTYSYLLVQREIPSRIFGSHQSESDENLNICNKVLGKGSLKKKFCTNIWYL